MKIAFIGGHLSPALSVIDAVPEGTQCLFIGRKYAVEGEQHESYEYKTITGKGIPFFNLTTGRLQRKLSRHTISSLGKIPGGFNKSYEILKKERPDVVVSFGGYLSVPICYAAKLLRIPVVIHEQTQHVGLANKITARIANKICISWESSAKYFPKKKTILTGNPIRKEVLEIATQPKEAHTLPVIYITGGSTGSHAINEAIKDMLPSLLPSMVVYHQSGNTHGYTSYAELLSVKEALPAELQKNYHLSAHYSQEESASLIHNADLIISRSGINTVTELLYLHKPAILIPLPHGQRNEQLANAELLKRSGLATIIEQDKLRSDVLLNQIREMFASINTYTVKSHLHDNERNMHAAEKLVEVVLHVAHITTNTQKNNQTS